MQIVVRDGKKEDVQFIFELIKELAVYEKAADEVENTIEQLIEDGFGLQPLYGVIVAENEGIIVGISIYYFRYSTWKGKRLYLEDIVVTEKMRGNGIGKLLFEASIQKAKEHKCNDMTWTVLDWNEPAINFYKKYGAEFHKEWVLTNISKEQLSKL